METIQQVANSIHQSIKNTIMIPCKSAKVQFLDEKSKIFMAVVVVGGGAGGDGGVCFLLVHIIEGLNDHIEALSLIWCLTVSQSDIVYSGYVWISGEGVINVVLHGTDTKANKI
ncbi:Hypothetical predicted protein [Octopus vulgaris]|uniref:Uncharacterized protein n=1 Tax=Octopus vulgaris TaxID=6645 RepID=A0AA36B8T6_OCTVU|nr:Hypothetical predicted protein [Octopus vulgaris]